MWHISFTSFFLSNVRTIKLGETKKLTELFNMQVCPLLLCLVGKSSYLLFWSQASLFPLLVAEWQTTFDTHKLHKSKEFITYYFMPYYSVASECRPAYFLFSCVHLEIKLTNSNTVHAFFFMVLFMFSPNTLSSAAQTISRCVL